MGIHMHKTNLHPEFVKGRRFVFVSVNPASILRQAQDESLL